MLLDVLSIIFHPATLLALCLALVIYVAALRLAMHMDRAMSSEPEGRLSEERLAQIRELKNTTWVYPNAQSQMLHSALVLLITHADALTAELARVAAERDALRAVLREIESTPWRPTEAAIKQIVASATRVLAEPASPEAAT